MRAVEGQQPEPLVLRRWLPWLLGAVAAIMAVAFVENLYENDWILAGCFGVGSSAAVLQLIALSRIRRRMKSPRPGARGTADRHS